MAEMPNPAFIVKGCAKYEGATTYGIYAEGANPVLSGDWLWTAEQVAELMERAVASLYGNAIEEFKAAYCK